MVFTEIVGFTMALSKRLPYGLGNGLAVDRILNHIRCTVSHKLKRLVAFASESTDHEHRKPKTQAVMLGVHLADFAQERFAIFDVPLDCVWLTLDLEIKKHQTEGAGLEFAFRVFHVGHGNAVAVQ